MKIRLLAMLAILLTSITFAPAAFAQKAQVSPANAGDAAEPSTNGMFVVTIDRARAFDTRVYFNASGTAVADTDYTAFAANPDDPLLGDYFVDVPAGATPTANITVAVIDNNTVEGTRVVTITLTDTDSGSVDPDPLNDNASVNITSDDVGLTLLKTVVNDEGGTAVDTDFTLTATGPDTISGVEGDASITNAVVTEGAYTLTESVVGGYTLDNWSCSGGQTNGADGTVTLASPDVATCTVTNTDDTPPAETATLTLAKTVVNDEGGTAVDTDFTLTATGPDTISGVEGDASITSAVVAVGDYALTESSVPGYTLDNWSCTSGLSGTTVTLAADDVVTCTVTNTDDTPPAETATLTLAKTVVNDEGGTAVDTDFTLTATGPDTISGVEGDASITSAVVAVGDYALTESAVAGYTLDNWSCTSGLSGTTVTLAADDVVTCTVTNTDDTPVADTATLTLEKTVVNDEGGTAVDTDFTLTATGPDTISGVEGDASITSAVVAVGDYALTESALAGYTLDNWSCTSGLSGTTVTLAADDVVTCTVTNTDDTPPAETATLTLEKTVVNDEGGTAVDTDFTLTATGPDTISGVEGDASITSAVVAVGDYALTESAVAGYTLDNWSCTSGLSGTTVTLAADDVVTCTVTNTDDTPVADTATLTLEKTVVNDEGGTAVDTDFTLTATGPDTISGVEGDASITSAVVAVGDYALTESAVAGYTLDNWSCTSGLSGTTVTLAADDVVTCTVTNTDDTPVADTATLTLEKTVVNDEGGTAVDTDFTLTATGPDTISGVEGDASITSAVVAVGDYALTESSVPGYTLDNWSCTSGLSGTTVTLAADDVVTCTVTNTDDTPVADTATLTLEKTVVNDEGGTAVDTDFTLTATGPDTISGVEGDASITSAVVEVGDYALTESAVPGYTLDNWSCTSGLSGTTVTLAADDVVTCTVTNTDDTPLEAMLELEKTANTVTYSLVDEVIFYSYLVKSTGNTFVPGPITVADDKETVTCPAVNTVGNNDDNLDPLEELTCTATHTVVQADIDAGSLTNVATASGDGGAVDSNQDDLTVTYASPVLTLDKSADVEFFSVAGDVINYSYLIVASEGPTVGPITVTDDKVTVACPDVNTVGNNDGQLDPDEELTCTASYAVVADDITAGFVTNVATASGNAGDTVSNEDTVTVDYLPPGTPVLGLEITALPESFIKVGDLIDLTYIITSKGNAPAIGPITLTDNELRPDISNVTANKAVTDLICPPVDSVGNNDGNLDVGEILICTAFLSVELEDTGVGFITVSATASASDEVTVSAFASIIIAYTPLPIPTLSEWSMILLSFLFLMMGAVYLRRRQLV